MRSRTINEMLGGEKIDAKSYLHDDFVLELSGCDQTKKVMQIKKFQDAAKNNYKQAKYAFIQGDYDKALNLYNEALRIYIKIDALSELLAGCYNGIANVYFEPGQLHNLPKALDAYKTAAKKYEKSNGSGQTTTFKLVEIYTKIANIYHRWATNKWATMGSPDYYDIEKDNKAIHYSKMALNLCLEFYRRTNNVNTAGCYQNLGFLYKCTKDINKASSFYKMALLGYQASEQAQDKIDEVEKALANLKPNNPNTIKIEEISTAEATMNQPNRHYR